MSESLTSRAMSSLAQAAASPAICKPSAVSSESCITSTAACHNCCGARAAATHVTQASEGLLNALKVILPAQLQTCRGMHQSWHGEVLGT